MVGIVIFAVLMSMFSLYLIERPQRGILVLAALTPFDGLLDLLPDGAFPPWWKEALCLATLGAAFFTPNRPKGLAPAVPWWPLAVILAAFGSISALVTAGIWGLLAIKVTFFYLVVVLIVVLVPFTSKDRDHLVSIMMVVAFVTSAYGIVQQFIGGAGLAAWGYEWNETIRTTGPILRSFSTFVQPFGFGLYVMMVLIVAGSVALSNPRRLRNKIFLILTPIMVTGMALSIVRASYLGLGLAGIFLSLTAYKWLQKYILAAGVLLVAIIAALPSRILKSVFSSSSFEERGSGWTQMFRDMLTYPVGQGLGITGAAGEKIARENGDGISPYQPDNYYVKLALEIGPIPVFLFIGILLICYVTMMRSYRLRTGEDRAFSIGVAAFIVASAAASLVATYLEIFPIDLYFWLLVSVGAYTVNHKPSGVPQNVRMNAN